MIMKNILVVPSCESGRGGGHIVRSRSLVQSLRRKGEAAFLYLPAQAESGEESISCIEGKKFDLIVLDRFKTSLKEFTFFREKGPVIGIDEGGCRKYCDFLIDIIPAPPQRHNPNMSSPRLLPLPKTRRRSFTSVQAGKKVRVLISFGMEDGAGLTLPVALSFSKEKTFDVNVVLPRGASCDIRGVTLLKPIENLREHLAEYDLVVTHFGLTAFEALYARVPVLLFSPGGYHKKLADLCGFYTLSLGEEPFFDEKLLERCRGIAGRFNLESDCDSEALCNMLCCVPRLPTVCPSCGASIVNSPVLARFSDRTYRLCKLCKVVFMLRLTPVPLEYSDEYFFNSYKKQYGLTYLEDFPKLVKMGEGRLNRIQEFSTGKRLLDIGCAYGPFLSAARDAGFNPIGVDPAENAVRYVKDTLGIQAQHGFFPAVPAHSMVFDVVSLWYVIEHFDKLSDILPALHSLLTKGGVLAISTPSYTGISGRICINAFLKSSPADHFSIWSPFSAGIILKRYGFRIKRVVVSTHHPERFPVLGGASILYPMLRFISAFFKLGDTFEIYAMKE